MPGLRQNILWIRGKDFDGQRDPGLVFVEESNNLSDMLFKFHFRLFREEGRIGRDAADESPLESVLDILQIRRIDKNLHSGARVTSCWILSRSCETIR